MNLKTFANANDFLQDTRTYVEQNEAVNGLMLGLAFRLAQFADQIKTSPNHIYQKIGCKPDGDFNEYVFLTAE